jgi:hypothetical protein
MGEASERKERRRYKRVPEAFPVMIAVRQPFEVRVLYSGYELDGIARDVGEGGIGILTSYDIPAGTLVGLRFRIVNDERQDEYRYRAFSVDGDVRFSNPDQKDHRLGVLFVNATEQDRRFIAEFVKDQAGKSHDGLQAET